MFPSDFRCRLLKISPKVFGFLRRSAVFCGFLRPSNDRIQGDVFFF